MTVELCPESRSFLLGISNTKRGYIAVLRAHILVEDCHRDGKRSNGVGDVHDARDASLAWAARQQQIHLVSSALPDKFSTTCASNSVRRIVRLRVRASARVQRKTMNTTDEFSNFVHDRDTHNHSFLNEICLFALKRKTSLSVS